MNEKLPYAHNYRELLVYKKAESLAENIFKESRSFPEEEVYSLTNQMRRSSRSVGTQIAEAWGKRMYLKHFVSKLTDAEAELNETEHWIETACKCDYLSSRSGEKLIKECVEIRRLLGGMILKADSFIIAGK